MRPFAIIILALGATLASAQDTTPARSGKSASSKSTSDHPWEVEFHAGAALSPRSTGGSSSLPVSTTNSNTGTDLLQPSLFFSNGATQASAVTTGNGLAAIVPYDNALITPQAQRQNGFGLGFRIGKDWNRWFGLEYSLDLNVAHLGINRFATDLAKTTASSYATAISPLAQSTAGVANGQAFVDRLAGSQLFNTISASFYLRPAESKWRPYVSVGGGFLHNTGGDPSVDLLGTIQLGGGLTETDKFSVRYQPQRLAAVAEFGAGVKHTFGEHWGIRFDFRDNMAWESIRTRIWANPVPPTGGTTTFLFSGNGHELAFSNDQGTLQSTLSTSLNRVTTFDANDIKHHVNASAGIFLRF